MSSIDDCLTTQNFGGVDETVVTRDLLTLERALGILREETIAFIGYGSQGPGQSQNARDNVRKHNGNLKIIVGQRQGTPTWDKAVADGWEPGKTLFDIEDAAERGTIVANLLSDAAQKLTWNRINPHLHERNLLYFSHGFGPHFSQHTGIVPPEFVDLGMIAPKGAGLSVRKNYSNGRGINSSFAIGQNYTGRALERTLAMGVLIGSGYLFQTTLRNEVVSDHFGERAILLGGIWALAEASYQTLREEGHTADRSFIHSSEQITQVILPLIGKEGLTGIYERAQKAGQLGTVLKYQDAVKKATKPVMNKLYKSCANGTEAKIALERNSQEGYRVGLDKELDTIENSEMWKTGELVRTSITDRTYGEGITNWGLAGAVLGMIEAQYQTLIDNGHTPSEAANETVEELTQSLNQFYQEKGAAYLLRVCSTTAQRGALNWGPIFRKVIYDVLKNLDVGYNVTDVLANRIYRPTNPEVWSVMNTVRELRPENQRR